LIVIQDETVCFLSCGDELTVKFDVKKGQNLPALDSDFDFPVSQDENPVVFLRDLSLARVKRDKGTRCALTDGLELSVGGVESLSGERLGGDDGELFCCILLGADAVAEVEGYDF